MGCASESRCTKARWKPARAIRRQGFVSGLLARCGSGECGGAIIMTLRIA